MTDYVEIHHNSERDTFEVVVRGEHADDWDIMLDLSEQEANDEAESIAAELDLEVVRT